MRKDRGLCSVFHIKGDVDLFNSDVLRDALMRDLEGQKKSIILDLTETDYMDSTGIGVIVAAWNKARSVNRDLMLASVSESIRRVLGLMQIDAHVRVFEHQDQAVASVSR